MHTCVRKLLLLIYLSRKLDDLEGKGYTGGKFEKKDVFYIRKKIPVYLIINISNDKKSCFNMIILD